MGETNERFEDLLKRLEQRVEALESDDLDLEAALEAYEDGVRLARECHRRLDEAERRIEILRRGEHGEPVVEPLEPGRLETEEG